MSESKFKGIEQLVSRGKKYGYRAIVKHVGPIRKTAEEACRDYLEMRGIPAKEKLEVKETTVDKDFAF